VLVCAQSPSSVFDYAFDRAFVILPPACVRAHNFVANAAERPNVKELWAGRLDELPSGSRIGDLRCGCGWVIFEHGSSGLTYDNWRYVTMMAAAGYGVLAPDSMAGPASTRQRRPVEQLAAHLSAFNSSDFRWWCDDNVYEGRCASFTEVDGSPLCFSSSAPEIISSPAAWSAYYERVYELRRRELVRVIERLQTDALHSIWASRIFLAGESEGGMVAARFYDVALTPRLQGTLILQWSCERNYFVPCEREAAVCGGKCSSQLPFLSLIAAEDSFFSASNRDSVAATVARAHKYQLKGDCFAQFARQQFAFAASVVLPLEHAAVHGLTEAVPNLLRSLIGDFLRRPREVASLSVLQPGAQLCYTTEESKGKAVQFSCHEMGMDAALH
jgi:dienelactone hydrolase